MKTIFLIATLVSVLLGPSPSFAQSKTMDKVEPEASGLKFETWQLIPVSLVLSPLILSTTQSDMGYGESIAVTTIGNLSYVGSFALGTLLLSGAASSKGVVSFTLGLTGAVIAFGAPVMAGLTMQLTDHSLGAEVNRSWIAPLMVAGGMMAGWTATGLILLAADLELDVLAALAGIIALNLVTSTTAYALSREAKRPTVTMSLPLLRF